MIRSYVKPFEESLVSADHTAEGFLVTLSDGNIMHLYRNDPGESGGHTGNGTNIMKRTYNVSTKEWGPSTVVYAEPTYDARNVHGGITSEGRIVMFFRRYDAVLQSHIDLDFMYSDDDGATWTNRATVSNSFAFALPFGDMIYVPTKGYMKGYNGSSEVAVQFSADGSSWDSETIVQDYSESKTYRIDETSFVYIGDGKIIALTRDERREKGHMYYQMTSSDYGTTWTEPVRTEIVAPFFCPSPLIFKHGDNVVVIATDRRSFAGQGDKKEDSLHIYIADANEAFKDPTAYRYDRRIVRPDSDSNTDFYGYPSIVALDDSRYLVIVTDKYEDDTNEDADIYQFELTLKEESSFFGEYISLPVFVGLSILVIAMVAIVIAKIGRGKTQL